MSDSDDILERLDQRVLTITLNRPDALNALTRPMMARLVDALERAAADDAVGAVLLTGAGRGFCAGGDVKAMAAGKDPNESLEKRTTALRGAMESVRLLHVMRKPTIAMVRGPAAGAGLCLALACDIIYASDTAKLTSAFVKIAASGDFGGAYFLTQRLGARAREFVMLSPTVGAEEARAMGLVDRVMADADLESATLEVVRRLASGPGVALGHIKANLNAAAAGASLEQVLDMEAERMVRTMATEDHAAAARAFVEKRPPVFKGK